MNCLVVSAFQFVDCTIFSAKMNRINVLAAADRPRLSFITRAIVRRIGSSTGRTATWESPVAPNEVPAPVCAAALTESLYHVRSTHEIFKVRFPQKEKTAHAAQRWILSGESAAK